MAISILTKIRKPRSIFWIASTKMPLRRGLLTARELPDKDLLCTHSGQVMLDETNARSLIDIIHEYYEEHKGSGRKNLGRTIS